MLSDVEYMREVNSIGRRRSRTILVDEELDRIDNDERWTMFQQINSSNMRRNLTYQDNNTAVT